MSGLTGDQSSGSVPALQKIEVGGIATKDDLRIAKTEIEAKIETTAANQIVDILTCFIVSQIALGGFIATIARLLHG